MGLETIIQCHCSLIPSLYTMQQKAEKEPGNVIVHGFQLNTCFGKIYTLHVIIVLRPDFFSCQMWVGGKESGDLSQLSVPSVEMLAELVRLLQSHNCVIRKHVKKLIGTYSEKDVIARAIAIVAKELGYQLLHPCELWSTARLHAPLWQKHHAGQDEVPPD